MSANELAHTSQADLYSYLACIRSQVQGIYTGINTTTSLTKEGKLLNSLVMQNVPTYVRRVVFVSYTNRQLIPYTFQYLRTVWYGILPTLRFGSERRIKRGVHFENELDAEKNKYSEGSVWYGMARCRSITTSIRYPIRWVKKKVYRQGIIREIIQQSRLVDYASRKRAYRGMKGMVKEGGKAKRGMRRER